MVKEGLRATNVGDVEGDDSTIVDGGTSSSDH